jgi:hypothetical protein
MKGKGRRVGRAQRNPPSTYLERTAGFAALYPPYEFICLDLAVVVIAPGVKNSFLNAYLSGIEIA